MPGGYFIEGTGLYGHSSLRKVEVATGKVLQSVPLERKYFGKYTIVWLAVNIPPRLPTHSM